MATGSNTLLDRAPTNAQSEAQIRREIDEWVKAVRAKDLNKVMAYYSPDVVTFDAVPPLQSRGPATYRKNWDECFAMFPGPIGYEHRDLQITAGDELAFAHALGRMTGTTTKGEQVDMAFRVTACYRKIGDKWVVVHEHVSAPFDPKTNKAVLDLKS
jgi:uncharacterized protein (TIGR02246 family)